MENPYQAPQVQSAFATPPGGEINPMVLEALRGTKGWVRFMAVLGFIGCAFMLLAAFALFVTPSVARSSGLGAGMGLFYLIITGVYFFLALRLNQYASRIGQFLLAPDGARLVGALDAQRSFWKCLGIMTIIVIAIYILLIVVVIGSAARYL
jgi:hypothetical protein